MDIPLLLLLSTVVWQGIDFLRELTNWTTQKSSIITQLSAWIGGVIVVLLAAHSGLFDGFLINGKSITSLDVGSQVFLGLGISSLASSAVDLKQAFDRSDSAAKPPLLKP